MAGAEGQSETGIGRSWRRGLAVELLVGIVLSGILAVAVTLAGGAMTAAPEPSTRPLVRCEVFETHMRCIREAS